MEIDAAVGGIALFMAGEFFEWHVRLYRRRPPYWALGSSSRTHLLPHDSATAEVLAPIVRQAGARLPARWARSIDDGIALGLAPLRSLVPSRELRRVLDEVAADATNGRFPWMAGDQTAM